MKLTTHLFFFIFSFTGVASSAQNLTIYTLNSTEKSETERIAFVSLSDSYRFDEESDSFAIPDIEDKNFEEVRYLELNTFYRKRFLAGTRVSETDSVFIYDYAQDILVSLAVKNLKNVACLNIYSSPNDAPFSQYDYQIGFEIDKNLLKGFDEYYQNSFVFVGKENPFERKQMKPMVWKKINASYFPIKAIDTKGAPRLINYAKGDAYMYERAGFRYFIQDFLSNDVLNARYLVVIDLKRKRKVCDKVFYDHESASPAPLNFTKKEYGDMINQWAGKLFKNKPSVVFGFEYCSFGCPSITFLQKSEKDIYISCDNRH